MKFGKYSYFLCCCLNKKSIAAIKVCAYEKNWITIYSANILIHLASLSERQKCCTFVSRKIVGGNVKAGY